MSNQLNTTPSGPSSDLTEYDVIVAQQGVPLCTVRASVDSDEPVLAARDMVASSYEGLGYTFDVVEISDEDGIALAVESMMRQCPYFDEHVRGLL